MYFWRSCICFTELFFEIQTTTWCCKILWFQFCDAVFNGAMLRNMKYVCISWRYWKVSINTAVFMCTGYFTIPVIKISLSGVSFFNVVFSKCKVAVNVTFVKCIKKVLRPFSSKHLFVALIKNRNLMPALYISHFERSLHKTFPISEDYFQTLCPLLWQKCQQIQKCHLPRPVLLGGNNFPFVM